MDAVTRISGGQLQRREMRGRDIASRRGVAGKAPPRPSFNSARAHPWPASHGSAGDDEKILGRPLSFYFGLGGEGAQRRVRELLALVELPASYAPRYPRQLSGGERQRVNLARALAAEPKLIVCDEITSALDTVVAQAILDLLRDLQERLEVGYLFISHDISTVARVADTIAVMQNGEVVEHGSTEDVLAPPHHPYTALLLKSVPGMKTDWLDTLVLPGPLERGGARAMAARTGA